jgi:hypothetical protein
MLSEDLISNVDSNTSGKDVDKFQGDNMNGLDEHKIGGMHGNIIGDLFGEANISEHVICQKGQKLNNSYTFVDEEEFNARPGPKSEVPFT